MFVPLWICDIVLIWRPQVSYPPAYVGDFGMSYLTSGDSSWISRLGRGTRGYFAPEQERPKPHQDDVSELVCPTSRSNVYQVGVTMMTAMIGPKGVKYEDDVGLVYEQDPAWNDMVENGQWPGYSDDLIDLVGACALFEMEERPSPQKLLTRIETLMPRHADGMDRWGTLSWVEQMSSELDESLAADDDTQMDEDIQMEDDAGTGATTGQKRKASGPPESAPDAKRIKAQAALKRRQTYVATLIKGVMPRPRYHKDDEGLRSRWMHRLVYKDTDWMFNPASFFDTPDPGPIEYLELEDDDQNRLDVIMVDDSEDDGQAHDP